MNNNVKVEGLDTLRRKLTRLSKQEVPVAAASALNRTGLAVERRLKVSMSRALDRPTPFTVNGVTRIKAYPNRLVAGAYVKKIQARYLKYAVYGGVLDQTLVPVGVRRDPFGNIPGKRQGLAAIAKRIKTAQIAGRYGAKATRRKVARGALSRLNANLPRDMFLGQIKTITGLWQRTSGGGLRLLVLLDRNARRRRRWDFHGIARRVILQRIDSDARDAFTDAIRKAKLSPRR